MEILLAPLVEVILAFATPMLLMMLELVALVLSLVFEVLGLMAEILVTGSFAAARAARRQAKARAREKKRGAAPQPAEGAAAAAGATRVTADGRAVAVSGPLAWLTSDAYHRWTRRLAWTGGGLLAATLLLFVMLNTLLFERSVKWIFAEVESRTAVAITFDSASGSLLTGRIELAGAAIRRGQHEVSEFDLQAGRVLFDINLWRMMRRQLHFQEVQVEDVTGAYRRVGKRDPDLPRKQFRIERLQIRQAQLEVQEQANPLKDVSFALHIETAELSPLRSEWALFDALHRTQASGQVVGQPFEIAAQPQPDGSTDSTWRLNKIPVHLAAAFLGGPFQWISQGDLDLKVVTRWSESDEQLDTRWSLQLRKLQARAPDELPLKTRLLAAPALAFIHQHTDDMQLEFELEIPKRAFQGQLWLASSDVSRQVGSAAQQKLLQLAGGLKDHADDLPDAVKRAGQELLDRLRKP